MTDDTQTEMTEEEMADAEFDTMMDAAVDLAGSNIDDLLDEADDQELSPDMVMYNMWMFATRYLAEAGWTADELQRDLIEMVAHQTSDGEA